ncbi:hypothetical protein RN001_015741 [Aquatica leii]|uniref:Uncharacterized protein n=1 Tax=Aquatica leii TaxID=1421715 RepID=A0AAN7NWQ3_9COLE|nr:hypothetical protein RN001_015741 [Aquatica leii]
MYNCFLCKNRDSTPVSYLENVSKTLSGIFDILVYNTKYVCHDCIIVLADALCAYKMLSIDIHRCLKKIKECRYIASYICQPMILPSTVAKPFGKVTVFDIVRNIHLVDIEDLMRNTDIYIEGRGILFSRKDISHLIMELQTQREVFKCLAEVTQHLSLNSHSEDYAMLDSDSEYDYVTPVASITKSLKGIHFEDQEDSYITPNAEEMPVDWLLLDMTSEPDDFFKDEEFLEECEEEEIEEFYEGPSCSYKIPSKYKK